MKELPKWSYLSKTAGVGGTIKEQVEDFIVNEEAELPLGEGDHVIIELTKFNLTTLEAIRELSNILHISKDRFGYAGNKDKKAITTQYISIKGISEHELEHLFIPQLELKVVGRDGRIVIGQLKHNRFHIVIRNINLKKSDLEDRLIRTWDELGGYFPNYFGPQRFGSIRKINHIVGKEILKENFGKAVWTYIAKPSENENLRITKVRRELWDSRDASKAAERFPERYLYEKMLLYHLSKNPKNYLGALRNLPDTLQRLFIHAYQAYVFNMALSRLIKEGAYKRELELPLVGYKTILTNKPEDKIVNEILEEDGISPENFKLKSLPELRTGGAYRKCAVPAEEFKIIKISEDDLNLDKKMVELSFRLCKGAYATTLLREFMKND